MPQPVVRTHPETGRKALFVSEHFTTRIVGLPEDESRALLDELFAHSVKPAHVYRHQWQPNDLVFWDNRSLLHLAAGTPDHLAPRDVPHHHRRRYAVLSATPNRTSIRSPACPCPFFDHPETPRRRRR